MIRTNWSHRSLVLAVLATVVSAAGANGQAVQYQKVERIDMGALNFALKLAGASESVTTTSLQGSRMRIDSDEGSFIFDVEAGCYILLDHEQRTYSSVPLEQLAAGAAALVTSFDAESDSGRATATIEDEEGTADFHFDAKIEPTSERRNINGHDAKRAFLTVETDIEFTPEGEARSEEVGTLVVLLDTWHAEAGPLADAARAFNDAAADYVVDRAFGRNRTPGALSERPGLATAIGKAAEESQQLDGLEVQSTTYLVLVPPGMSLDRTALLESANNGGVAASLRGAAEQVAREAAQEAAQETARQALPRAIRGRMPGGGRQEPAAEEPGPPEQAVIMKMITEIREVRMTTLPASTFEVPAGYREIAAVGASGR